MFRAQNQREYIVQENLELKNLQKKQETTLKKLVSLQKNVDIFNQNIGKKGKKKEKKVENKEINALNNYNQFQEIHKEIKNEATKLLEFDWDN